MRGTLERTYASHREASGAAPTLPCVTRLYSIVIPAAVVVLATATPGTDARARKPVILPTDWAAVREPVPRAVEHAGDPLPRASAVELTALLPLADLPTASAVAASGGSQATLVAPVGDDATGGAVAPSARGPP